MRKRIVVRGCEIKVVHLELFSVHSDDVSLGVTRSWLFMQHLDRPFDNLIVSLPICSDQAVNVAKHKREIVQVEPEQSPACDEHRANPAFHAVVFPVKDQSGYTSNQGSYADEQSENFASKNSVTVCRNFKDSDKIRYRQDHFSYPSTCFM